jgi:aspartokinase
VYWEPVIRVYGFDIRKDISLIELEIFTEHAAYWGEHIHAEAQNSSDFIMVLAQYVDQTALRLCIAMQQDKGVPFCQTLEDKCKKEYSLSIQIRKQVDALFFHGPHFQDRYGIIAAALRSLDNDQITLYSSGCTGTSVYLIIGSGQADLAKEMLAKSFVVPGFSRNSGNN